MLSLKGLPCKTTTGTNYFRTQWNPGLESFLFDVCSNVILFVLPRGSPIMQGNVSFRVVKTSLTRSSTVRDLPDARACESGKTDQAT